MEEPFRVKVEKMDDPETCNPTTTNEQQLPSPEKSTCIASIQQEDNVVREDLVGDESNQIPMNTAGCSMMTYPIKKEEEHVVSPYSSFYDDKAGDNKWNGENPKLKDRDGRKYEIHSTISNNNLDMTTGDGKQTAMSAYLTDSRGDPNKCLIVKADTGEICEVIDMNKESNSQSELINMKEKQCRYEDCGFTSKSKFHLVRHERFHSGEKGFKCDECNFASSYPSSQKRHNLLMHTGAMILKCDKCDYSSSNQSNLNKHKHKHTGDRSFKCDECNFATSHPSSLKRHKLMHTGVWRFKCDKCCYGSLYASHLKLHKLIHTGVKPFNCNKCG